MSLRARSVLGAKNEEKNPEQKKLNFWVTIAKGLAPNEQKCIHASSAENIIEIDESQIQWTAIRYIYFVLLLRASSIIVKIEHAKALRPVATLFISIIFRRLRCRQGPLQHKGPENQIFRKSARNSWRASIYKMIQQLRPLPSPPLTQKMDNKLMLSMLKLMLVRGGVGV